MYYADRLSPEGFAEEEARLSKQIEAVRREREELEAERARLSEVAAKFEEVARVLREMNVDRLWAVITDVERRVLVEELLESVAMFPDHLEVTVSGAPRLNVTLEEVGPREGGGSFVVSEASLQPQAHRWLCAGNSGCAIEPFFAAARD